MKRLGTYILMGIPSKEKINQTLETIDMINFYPGDSVAPILYSDIIDLYAKTRSFKTVALTYGVKRPDVRRALSLLSKTLLASKKSPTLALGAYVFGLIDKASAQGRGLSQRERAKICPIYRRDPEMLGKFEVDVAAPEFDNFLLSRANN
jgi:hypothetical protein